MIGLFLLSAIVGQPASSDPAVALCKPLLARKAGGEIATIDVAATRVRHGVRTVEGQLTAFIGMGAAPAGSASTHHLIRAQFTYRCRVSGTQVREARLNPL